MIIFWIYKNLKKKINNLNHIIKSRISELNEKQKEINSLNKKNANLNSKITDYKKKIDSLEKKIKRKDELYESLKEHDNGTITQLSRIYADFLLVQYDISYNYLTQKRHPAKREARRIKELKKETKLYIEQFRQMEYKYEILLQLFPELSYYVDDFDTIKKLEDINTLENLQADFDRVKYYISDEEYNKLTVNERNQLALDNYIKGQKSKWQIGRDYELYCGLEYEKQGWIVEYIGMEKKLSDMGRDLIATKNNEHHIIQCKYWSKEKKIHEKHITQLFGSAIEYGLNKDKSIKIIPVFITNITLSDIAIKFADRLGVKIIDNYPLKEFPRIKCNINKDENGRKTKIYHLPFDQQYDRTKIDKEGEFYAYTVEEAVNKGYRRAYRYYGK